MLFRSISLEGPKGVGKTSTARMRAKTYRALDHPPTLEVLRADPDRLLGGAEPILIDEWQRFPASWDLVRRAVDGNNRAGRFLLAGSASPQSPPSHSGAGRIVTVKMRPLTLFERGVGAPTVSLSEMLKGERPAITGSTGVTLADYVDEIVSSGFPGIRNKAPRSRRALLDGYLTRIVDTDFLEAGQQVRINQDYFILFVIEI